MARSEASSRVRVGRFFDFSIRGRVVEPLPELNQPINHYAQAQQRQHHHNRSAHIVNGDRSGPKTPKSGRGRYCSPCRRASATTSQGPFRGKGLHNENCGAQGGAGGGAGGGSRTLKLSRARAPKTRAYTVSPRPQTKRSYRFDHSTDLSVAGPMLRHNTRRRRGCAVCGGVQRRAASHCGRRQ